MAKKTKSGAYGTRKKTVAQKRKKKPTRRRPVAPGRELKLAVLRRQLERAIKRLKAGAKREGPHKDTILRLQTWVADIDEICDPENPHGCGPVMVFPS